jgi:hypothetical protein
MQNHVLAATDYVYRSRVFVSDRYGHICHLTRHRILRRTPRRIYFSRRCEMMLDEGSWIPHWNNDRFKPRAYGSLPRRLFERLGKAAHERDVYYQVPPRHPARFRRPSIDFLRREAGLDPEALRRLMHKAHPDKGGTVEEFRRIRKLYERAKARVVREEALYGSQDIWDTWFGRAHPPTRRRRASTQR